MDSNARWIAAPDLEDFSAVLPSPAERAWRRDGPAEVPDGGSALGELLAGLERDPEESWNAFRGLEAIDSEGRLRIVAELVKAPPREGLIRLLHLLGASRDPETRAAVRQALGTGASTSTSTRARTDPGPAIGPNLEAETVTVAEAARGRAGGLAVTGDRARPRLIYSSVSALDGEGVGAIVVTSVRGERTTTAAFLCDVLRGIRDALGVAGDLSEVEERFAAPFPELVAGPTVEDDPELALGLLAGSLMMSGRSTPARAREWLDQALGAGFHSGAFLATKAEWTPAPTNAAVLAERSWSVLEACPTWVDRSTLTFELAEEITLRDRRAAADPVRDAGAYRFLFERRLIHRLELYQRMLLWMAFFWDAAGERELSLSAGVLAGQLADEQYAVPGHPFAVALTTRSLHEAQRLLGTPADPRRR